MRRIHKYLTGRILCFGFAALFMSGLALSLSADEGPSCDWVDGFSSRWPDDPVRAAVAFDDGGGTALFVGGDFVDMAGQTVNHIAKWDGSSWSPLGTGTDGTVHALAVFDDGSGTALFVGGNLEQAGGMATPGVAKWDGTTWSAVGGGIVNEVFDFAVFDDGSGAGPALYAVGRFSSVNGDGTQASNIARWDGTTWSPLGQGLGATTQSLAVFDDGNGPALYAAGYFSTAGGAAADHVAKWDGTTWSAVGPGLPATVNVLEVFDDGSGAALYAGTSGVAVDSSRLARWDGTTWTRVGTSTGVAGPVYSLAVFDDGSGDALYAGGAFTTADGVESRRVAKWDGTAWSSPGLGMNLSVTALSAVDLGSGPLLFAGGEFTDAGETGAAYLAKWNGTAWAPLPTPAGGVNDVIRSFAVFDDGQGPDLYVGGDLTGVGDLFVHGIARWDGTAWSALGEGPTSAIQSLAVYNDGTGPALFAVTRSELWKWDGTAWSMLQSFSGNAHTLRVFDDGNGAKLYVAGKLSHLVGGDLIELYVGTWDGTTWSLSPYALEMGDEPEEEIFAMESLGDYLYAGGKFSNAENVIRRSGIEDWDTAGSGLTGWDYESVLALEAFDAGDGPILYAGGTFTTAGQASTDYLARQVDGQWVALPAVPDGPVSALALFDDGSGQAFYAGGSFGHMGATATNRIARFDGTTWSPLGAGIDDRGVTALKAFHDGTDTSLFAGGTFARSAGLSSSHIAQWQCSGAPAPNVGVTVDNGVDEVSTGDTVTYTITVTSNGPVDVPAAELTSTFSSELTCARQSFGTGGTSGYSEDSGSSFTDTLVLPAGGTVTYTLLCTVPSDAPGSLTHTVSISAPWDGTAGDDMATDTDSVIDFIFSDDFESGDCSQWGVCP